MSKKVNDPFNRTLERQAVSYVPPPEPPDGVSVDAPGGGTNPPTVNITEENHHSFFKKEKEHSPAYNEKFGRGKK